MMNLLDKILYSCALALCLSPTFTMPHQNAMFYRTATEARVSIRNIIQECNGDTELLCARLGFDLIRNDELLSTPVQCYLHDKTIVLRKGMTRREEINAIGHECAHYLFHASTTAWQTLDRFRIQRDEREADLFAASINTEEEFFI